MHQQNKGQRSEVMTALASVGARYRAPRGDDLLLALDDTDNLESPGTGYRARELAMLLAQAGLGRPMAITRHQLLVDPAIPYTSHNSSACLVLIDAPDERAAFALATKYLSEAAAPGSDVGTVALRRQAVDAELQRWGHAAKSTVLRLADARTLAARQAAAAGLQHAELSGTGGGLIGSLAAVGLASGGADGRLLWLRGIREAANQVLPLQQLADELGLAVQTVAGASITDPAARVDLGEWPRAVLRGHQPVLLVENNDEPSGIPWRCVDRDTVKRLSS